MADTGNPQAGQSASSTSSQAAYQRELPAIEAVRETRILNLDIMSAILLLLAKLTGILALRDVLKSTLNDFDEQAFDRLPDLIRAAQHANGLYLQTTKAPGPLQALVDHGERERDLLYADAVALAKRGYLNIDSLREVKRTTGHRILIVDLQILHATFDQKLAELAGRTSVTREELDVVQGLIDTLSEAVGSKEHSQAAQARATVIRAKAFTLLMDTYDEIRAGITYIRRKHRDADEIAPSAFITRPNSNAKRPSEDDEAPASTGVHAVVDAGSASPATSTQDLSATLAQGGPMKRSGGQE